MSSTETNTPVLVIGYGNALRGDDGAGPAAAAALRDQLPLRIADVRFFHQLLPELSEVLSVSSSPSLSMRIGRPPPAISAKRI